MSATATARLCGRRWGTRFVHGTSDHRCDEPANQPAPCTCRCGATTTKEQR